MKFHFGIFCFLLLTTMACNASTTPTVEPIPPAVIEAPSTPTENSVIPLTEADVPRISLEEALAAHASGAAVFVDVRVPQSYEQSHIPGSLNIQLEKFEKDPMGLGLDKEQWIITYCA